MIAISATRTPDFKERVDSLSIFKDDRLPEPRLTTFQNFTSFRKLLWLPNSSSIFFTSYIPAEQFYIIDSISGEITPFVPELKPKIIYKVSYDNTIFFATHHRYWSLPALGHHEDCQELYIDGQLVSVSSDGQWMVIYKVETPHIAYIHQIHTNTTFTFMMNMYSLLDDDYCDIRTLEWSPSNEYLSCHTDYGDLWILRADGTQRHKVAELAYFWMQYKWSPDSQSIAFIGNTADQEPDLMEGPLYVTNIHDPAPRYIASIRKNSASNGAWDWMPDSQHIIYAIHNQDQAELYTINIHTGNQKLLTDPQNPFAVIYEVAASP